MIAFMYPLPFLGLGAPGIGPKGLNPEKLKLVAGFREIILFIKCRKRIHRVNLFSKHILLALLIMLLAHPARAEVLSLEGLKAASDVIEKLLEREDPKDILLIINIDTALTHSDQPATFPSNVAKHRAIYHQIVAPLTRQEQDLVAALAASPIAERFCEEDAPAILQGLQKKGLKIIGFSALLDRIPDKIRDISLLTERTQKLQAQGINFHDFLASKDLLEESFMQYCAPCSRVTFSCSRFSKGILHQNGLGGRLQRITPSPSPLEELSSEELSSYVIGAFLKALTKDHEISGGGERPDKIVRILPVLPKHVVMVDRQGVVLETIDRKLSENFPQIHFMGLGLKNLEPLPPQEMEETEFRKYWEGLVLKAKKTMKWILGSFEKPKKQAP